MKYLLCAPGGEAKQAVVRADSTFLVYSIAFMELARQVGGGLSS
jgi:hypothetical protein